MDNVRAKFKCEQKIITENGAQILFKPVTATTPENGKFFKWTPSGTLEMGLVNLDVSAYFIPGKFYYLDFTIADE